MTTEEAIRHMRENTPLNQVMVILMSEAARLEQDGMQRRPSTPIQCRAMMLDGVERVLAKAEEVGLIERVDLSDEPTESEQGLIPIPDGYAER